MLEFKDSILREAGYVEWLVDDDDLMGRIGMMCWIGIITTSSSPVVRCLVTFVVRLVL